MINIFILFVLTVLLSLGAIYNRYREKKGKPPGLFYDFWRNQIKAFKGWNLFLQIGAVAVTLIMIFSGIELEVQTFFQKTQLLGKSFPYILLMVGNFWHIIAGIVIYWIGKRKNNTLLIGSGLAGIQAVLSTVYVNTIQKMISGRRGPLHFVGEILRETPFIRTKDPLDFQFDFWNHSFQDGRFFWPSGHTATIMAFVTTLVYYFPERKWIAWVGYPLVLMMGFALVDGNFHWTSDVVAGLLIGYAVGLSVGKSFRQRYYSKVETHTFNS